MNPFKILSTLFLLSAFSLTSCHENKEPKQKKEHLIEISNGVFTEYYPGKKAIKFRGPVDENKLRDGRWFFYDEEGNEQSMTEYSKGKKNGFTWVRYPNGSMRYTGEYSMDKEVGLWKFYNQDGSILEEKDYSSQ